MIRSDVLDSSQNYWSADTMDWVSPTVITLRMLEFVTQMNLLQTAQMATFVWWVVVIGMKVEWRYATATDGQLCVMTAGTI